MPANEQDILLKPIGIIHTPYKGSFCPVQPVERDEGESRVEIFPEYREGLAELESFSYIYVISHLHLVEKEPSLVAQPPWAKGKQVGLFASRSPNRPNPIGISIVKLKKIEGGEIFTSVIDVWDETPLLDLKPYIGELDSKPGANNGWIEEVEDYHHLLEHVRGVPHEHHEGHGHHHHGDGHEHDHHGHDH